MTSAYRQADQELGEEKAIYTRESCELFVAAGRECQGQANSQLDSLSI